MAGRNAGASGRVASGSLARAVSGSSRGPHRHVRSAAVQNARDAAHRVGRQHQGEPVRPRCTLHAARCTLHAARCPIHPSSVSHVAPCIICAARGALHEERCVFVASRASNGARRASLTECPSRVLSELISDSDPTLDVSMSAPDSPRPIPPPPHSRLDCWAHPCPHSHKAMHGVRAFERIPTSCKHFSTVQHCPRHQASLSIARNRERPQRFPPHEHARVSHQRMATGRRTRTPTRTPTRRSCTRTTTTTSPRLPSGTAS